MDRRLARMRTMGLLLVLMTACATPATPSHVINTLQTAPTQHVDTPTPRLPTPTLAVGSVVKGQVTSQALANNLIGDPATRDYYVYLPPSYNTSNKRYPVVYVLHWYTGDATTYTAILSNAMDWLVFKGQAREMILVYPDANNKSLGSMYMNSPTTGGFETYITNNLVAHIDATYRTLPGRDSRGVTGCSMGGIGSLHLAFSHPDVFGVAAPMSGMFDWEHEPAWELAKSKYVMEPQSFFDFYRLDFAAQVFIALAAVAAPNPNKPPLFLDMPFRLVDGKPEIVPEVFRKVNALDPLNDARRYLDQPVRLRGLMIYVDSDRGDTPEEAAFSVESARSFDKSLTSMGIQHEFVEIDAAHCNFDPSPILQFMDARLAF